MPKSIKEKSFEELMDGLESLVAQLESGELELDASISQFQEGVKLYSECKKRLTGAEKKVKKLTETLESTDLEA